MIEPIRQVELFIIECTKHNTLCNYVSAHLSQTSTDIRNVYWFITEVLLRYYASISSEDIELFTNNPEEYLTNDKFNDNYSLRRTTIELIKAFISISATSQPSENLFYFTLNHCHTSLAYSNQISSYAVESALELIQHLKSYLVPDTASKYGITNKQMEDFLMACVIPQLASSHNFVRSKSCEVIGKYYNVQYTENCVSEIIARLIDSLKDGCIVVAMNACTALNSYIALKQYKHLFRYKIKEYTSQLLHLMSTTYSELLLISMRLVIELYTPELITYGLIEPIIHCISTHCATCLSKNKEAPIQEDPDENLALNGYVLTILQGFKIVETLFDQLQFNPDYAYTLQGTTVPFFSATLGPIMDQDPEYSDAQELSIELSTSLRNCLFSTYSLGTVHPDLWMFYSNIVAKSKSDLMFFDEYASIIENYATIDVATFISQTGEKCYFTELISTITLILANSNKTASITTAFELVSAIAQALKFASIPQVVYNNTIAPGLLGVFTKVLSILSTPVDSSNTITGATTIANLFILLPAQCIDYLTNHQLFVPVVNKLITCYTKYSNTASSSTAMDEVHSFDCIERKAMALGLCEMLQYVYVDNTQHNTIMACYSNQLIGEIIKLLFSTVNMNINSYQSYLVKMSALTPDKIISNYIELHKYNEYSDEELDSDGEIHNWGTLENNSETSSQCKDINYTVFNDDIDVLAEYESPMNNINECSKVNDILTAVYNYHSSHSLLIEGIDWVAIGGLLQQNANIHTEFLNKQNYIKQVLINYFNQRKAI